MLKPIALTGFYGSGKTGVGRRVAQMMEVPFTDLIDEIERVSGLRVQRIYETMGEGAFREFERLALSSTAAYGGVLATTAGCQMMPCNQRLLHQNFLVFYLDAPFDYVYNRIGTYTHPSIQGLNKSEIFFLHKMRRPIYKQYADHVLDATQPVQKLVDRIVDLAMYTANVE